MMRVHSARLLLIDGVHARVLSLLSDESAGKKGQSQTDEKRRKTVVIALETILL